MSFIDAIGMVAKTAATTFSQSFAKTGNFLGGGMSRDVP
jgi:hypothetical protein